MVRLRVLAASLAGMVVPGVMAVLVVRAGLFRAMVATVVAVVSELPEARAATASAE